MTLCVGWAEMFCSASSKKVVASLASSRNCSRSSRSPGLPSGGSAGLGAIVAGAGGAAVRSRWAAQNLFLQRFQLAGGNGINPTAPSRKLAISAEISPIKRLFRTRRP